MLLRCGWVLAVLAATSASAFRLHLTNKFRPLHTNAIVSQGPMYATRAPPFPDGESFIGVSGLLSASAAEAEALMYMGGVNISFVFVDATTDTLVGYPEEGLPLVFQNHALDLCCTLDNALSGRCGMEDVGSPIVRQSTSGAAPDVTTVLVDAVNATNSTQRLRVPLEARYTVLRPGDQWLIVMACALDLDDLPVMTLDLEVTFHNPYGYLPGMWFGYLPFYGVMMSVYALFALTLCSSMCVHRAHIIPVQWAVLVIVIMSAMVCGGFFAVYSSHNESGEPICCPVTSDAIFAIIMSVVRGALARSALLAVALGFGVVNKSLGWCTTLLLVALALMYMGSDLTLEVLYIVFPQQASGEEKSRADKMNAATVVTIVDLIYLISTFFSISRTLAYLDRTQQATKRAMYALLQNLLIAFAAIWFIMGIVNASVVNNEANFPWQYLWVLEVYFEVLMLIILVTVAWIWRPGPDTERYAFYTEDLQDPASSEHDPEDQGADSDEEETLGAQPTTGTAPTDAPRASSPSAAAAVIASAAPAHPSTPTPSTPHGAKAAVPASPSSEASPRRTGRSAEVELTERAARTTPKTKPPSAAAGAANAATTSSSSESRTILAAPLPDEDGFDVEWPEDMDDMDDPEIH